jgi:hypothetical protein
MNISKTALWLSVLVAILVLIASGAGLLFTSTYARETTPWAIQAVAQDIANLVSVAVLLMAVYFVSKGSVKALLVWMGALLTLLYAYVIYAFAAHFNSLFLVYVAIVGLSFYTFLSSVLGLQPDRLWPRFVASTKAKAVSAYLLLVAVLFALLWLSQDIPAILAGKAPQSVTANGLLTNPVHVLDLGLYLPAMIITAMFLWRRKFLGYFFAIPLLVFSILTGIGIIAIDVVTGMRGLPTSLGVDLFIAAISVVSLVLSVLFVRDVQDQKDVSFA